MNRVLTCLVLCTVAINADYSFGLNGLADLLSHPNVATFSRCFGDFTNCLCDITKKLQIESCPSNLSCSSDMHPECGEFNHRYNPIWSRGVAYDTPWGYLASEYSTTSCGPLFVRWRGGMTRSCINVEDGFEIINCLTRMRSQGSADFYNQS